MTIANTLIKIIMTMYKTEHGDFNGTTWRILSTCFKRKYEAVGYQETPVIRRPRNWGFYTKWNFLNQVGCPGRGTICTRRFVWKQRGTKLTPIWKVNSNEKELKQPKKDIKVKQWIFCNPGYKKERYSKASKKKQMNIETKLINPDTLLTF
jgi:hypothetical protein